MPLLNYTTEISANKTVMEIQKMLAKAGASAVLNEYDQNGYIIAMSFRIKLNDQDLSFKLPTDWRPVLKILENDRRVPRSKCTQEQALRVAWRITKDWVEAQLAIIETKMVTTAQVFLPYAVTATGELLYQHVANNTNLLLGGGDA